MGAETMNNWHIKIEDCNEAQKERLKQVYGYSADSTEYFGIGLLGVTCFPKGELITPDEAFERLGLDEDTKALAKCENSLLKAQVAELKSDLETTTNAFNEMERNEQPLRKRIAGLEHAIGCRKEDLFNAEKKIKELTQQLAAKSELQRIDWTLVDSDFTHLVQDKKTGGSRLLCAGYYSDHKDCYHLIATRPKPKYTPEQIEAAKAYDEWLDLNSGEFEGDCFEAWLKEVGNGY